MNRNRENGGEERVRREKKKSGSKTTRTEGMDKVSGRSRTGGEGSLIELTPHHARGGGVDQRKRKKIGGRLGSLRKNKPGVQLPVHIGGPA